jgi:cytochrome b561
MEEPAKGQMFANSFLKKTTPLHHFLLSLLLGIIGTTSAKVILNSREGVTFMGCVALLFFSMFNPWLSLLANDIKKYFLQSLLFYLLLAAILMLSIHLLSGENIFNQWGLRIIVISSTFFFFVAYGTMRLTKFVLDDENKL